MNKKKYFKKIEKRYFKNATLFRRISLVVDAFATKIKISIIKDVSDFNEYVLNLKDCKEDEGFLLIPTLKIRFNNSFFEFFDVFLLDNNLVVVDKYTTNNVDYIKQYHLNTLILKKNISKNINLDIKSKINLKKLFYN